MRTIGILRDLVLVKNNLLKRSSIKRQVREMEPWYQPISFGYGLSVCAVDKEGKKYTHKSLDRGIMKWKRFLKPNLPFTLEGKRVLEVGCNAGLFLHECIREGAVEAIGIEKDEHYWAQSRLVTQIFSDLTGRFLPVRVYRESMENFNYEGLGYFDLAMLLASIYHIGKSADYVGCSPDEIMDLQVKTLRSIARIAKFILLQGNPQVDEGRGKGRESLLHLVQGADLEVVREKIYNDPRGYILLVASKKKAPDVYFTPDRMVSKFFLSASQSPERELVDLYLARGKGGFDIEKTRYFSLRTGRCDWTSPGMSKLPKDLDKKPKYWVMPWAYKPKYKLDPDIQSRERAFPRLFERFTSLIDSILAHGFDDKRDKIPGYVLVHPELGIIFVYIDGNHRMGILSYIADHDPDNELKIPVKVLQEVRRDELCNYPLAKSLIAEGYFSEDDIVRWFDNAFFACNLY